MSQNVITALVVRNAISNQYGSVAQPQPSTAVVTSRIAVGSSACISRKKSVITASPLKRRTARKRSNSRITKSLRFSPRSRWVYASLLLLSKIWFAATSCIFTSQVDLELARTTMRLNLYRVAHGCEFLETVYEAESWPTKVSAIDGAVFDRYLKWRVEKRATKYTGATIRRDVIRDELLSIRKMFLYAKKEKLCAEKSVPHWDFVIEKEAPARRRMTQRNYTDVTNTIRSWVREAKNEKDLYHRRMLHSIFLLISNSGMRSGEVFGLRNRDVDVRASKAECVLTIRPETSKVRKGRRITCPKPWWDVSRTQRESITLSGGLTNTNVIRIRMISCFPDSIKVQ